MKVRDWSWKRLQRVFIAFGLLALGAAASRANTHQGQQENPMLFREKPASYWIKSIKSSYPEAVDAFGVGFGGGRFVSKSRRWRADVAV